MRFSRLCGLLLVMAPFASGCGGSSPDLCHLSGTVTFKGQPLSAGRILFLPDSTKGNSGQAGYAEIKEGAYDTRRKGAAASGGALIVRIDGYDGKTSATNLVGQPLFLNYEIQIDASGTHSTKDFVVPVEAGNELPKVSGEPP